MVDAESNKDEIPIQSKKNTASEELSSKRLREEMPDNGTKVLSKKPRLEETVALAEKLETNGVEKMETNGVEKMDGEDVKNTSDNNADIETKGADDSSDLENDEEKKQNEKLENDEEKEENKTEENTKQEEKDDNDTKEVTEEVDENKEETAKAEIFDEKLADDKIQPSEPSKKNKSESSEIVNGVELTVECASDKESDESEKEASSKPISKTKIVHEKPNDSEVEASPTDDDTSVSEVLVEPKSKTILVTPSKVTNKRGRKKISSFSKAQDSASENEGSNSDDEDYSPVLKKSAKKSPSIKKSLAKPAAVRGRGRPRGRPPKNSRKIEKSFSEDEDMEKSIKKKKEEKSNNSDDSMDDNSDHSTSDNKHAKSDKTPASQRDSRKIENLKKFIRTAGIRISNYQVLLKDCNTESAKARRLSQVLEEHGLVGRPTIEKCKKLRIKIDSKEDMEELDLNNIVSNTNTRGRTSRKATAETEEKAPTTPVKNARKTLKKIKAVVKSDSE